MFKGDEVRIGFMGMELEHRFAIIVRTFEVAGMRNEECYFEFFGVRCGMLP